MTATYRIAVVGAASLSGKEINEALAESTFAASDFLLLDDEQALGQLESVGDEVTFIQRIEPGSFEQVDFTFFCGSRELTRKHWKAAQRAGSSIIDLSRELENERGVLIRAPWVREEMNGSAPKESPDLHTPAVVPAHPAAVTIALLMLRLKNIGAVHGAAVTMLEPASEYGRAAMDELHQQTVSLLSFQSLPREIYDTQVAFNCVPVLGEAAKLNLGETEATIRRHYAHLSGGKLPQLALQLIHAPVFHGYAFSIAVEMEQAVLLEDVESALSGEHVDVLLGDADAPSNLSTAGQDEVLVRLRGEGGPHLQRFWIWAAVDNLKFAAVNAVACAQELRRLRPQGQVQ
jgi:aspartate-semialdehyde dehydrogenase